MPELFIELFSEEIPARMQRNAAADLERAIAAALAAVAPKDIQTWYGARRLALKADVQAEVAAASSVERGPRANAPEQALTGFLRKHNATRDQLRQEGDYWVLEKSSAAVSASELVAGAMPGLLRRFPWPKSMRWGESSFMWVRPLRRIICLLDGAVVPFDLRDGADDGHGLAAGDLTEGHRFHAPGAFAVSSAAAWLRELTGRRVLADAADRKRVIAERVAGLAAEKGLAVVDDPGLLDEVAGLVEWPVPHLGRIADEHMDLPPEVMQVSMRVNQRYFALRSPDGAAAPWFAFVANIEADDGGKAIVAGNERVLRARFADARHFWDLDRKTKLADRVPALEKVTFQAKLGTQGERVRRLVALARAIAPKVGADPDLAARAAELAKADLVSGMVGEFPELQGVMGRYYALHDAEDAQVADAVRDHYAPRGPNEAAPSAPVSVAVALADKLDQLVGFFAIGEKPTGSGDPYALRRAALGVIRIIRENGLRLRLRGLLPATDAETAQAVLGFILERLVVQLRTDGARYDVLNAVFGAAGLAKDDDLVDLLARTEAVSMLLRTKDGVDLLAAYRRAANILRIESRKDGPHEGAPSAGSEPAEIALFDALAGLGDIREVLEREDYTAAMAMTARLRAPLDLFFDKVTVNAPEPELRRNRLRLLNHMRSIMDQIADFSRIEG
ncbi:MAG TPA: glycine--tRNA ligase subunit beta [Rhodopila sp.]|uniref:glycine--tRNA ligase subunit beta n=1 Tax=Rhodopila sp. TaxID=2480087 RepID=UPI002BC1918C|nr:glycine--tRNA ligase subunit beta [Rhodopila sp.]HVY18073.1 glycine--tRNA ligase subunit beta [Rhodopila sp.]